MPWKESKPYRVVVDGVQRWSDAPANWAAVQALAGSAIAGIALITFAPGSGWIVPVLLMSALAMGTHGYLTQKNQMAIAFLSFGPEGFACRSFEGGRLFDWDEIAAIRFSRFGLHVAFNDPSLQQKMVFDWTEFWRRSLSAEFGAGGGMFRGPTFRLALAGFFMPYSAIAEDEDNLKRNLRPLFERYAPLFEEFAS